MEAPSLEEGEALPETAELEMQKEWVQQVEKMLKTYKTYKPDRQAIDRFLSERFDFQIYNMYAYNLTVFVFQYFQAGITQRTPQFNVDYLRIIEKLYFMMSERSRRTFHKHFVDEWQHYPIDYTPYFESLMKNYETDLFEAIEAVEEDPDNIDRQVWEKIRYYIMVTPVGSLSRICFRATRNPDLIVFTMNICRLIPVLFENDRPLKAYHNEYETNKPEPLLALIFRRLVFNCRCEYSSDIQWDALEVLSMAFIKGPNPLMSCWKLLDVVLCELYVNNRIPTKSIETLTGIASRILSPKNMENMETWKFAISKRAQPQEGVFLTPTIIDTMLKLMVEYHENKKSIYILENCKAILQCLGNRMREENAEFDEETRETLLDTLKTMPWWVEYTMSTWFWALNVHKRRVPSGIFRAICVEGVDVKEEEESDEDEETSSESGSESDAESESSADVTVMEAKMSDKFEEIRDPQNAHSLPEQYLRAIEEIGLFDVECALELLHTKTSIKFKDEAELIRLIEKTLTSRFAKDMGLHGYEDARILLMQILEVFDKWSDGERHEEIAESIRSKLVLPACIDDTPPWTHAIEKSVIMQSLEPEFKPKYPWPPVEFNKNGPTIVLKGGRALRRQQKKLRERLLKSALAKSRAVAQHHRATWAERKPANDDWYSPPSPPAESSRPESTDSDRVEGVEVGVQTMNFDE